MTYDANKPANDGFLAEFPPEMREQLRAIIQDAIVNAGLLNGLKSGNGQGNIPVSNGVQNVGLNAERHGGNLPSAYAIAGHGHSVATGSSNGFMANTDVAKLATIATSAEVNQMAFSNVLIAGTTIQADSETDTLEIVAGANITITPDATNDRVTIAVTGKVESAKVADSASVCTGNSASASSLANFSVVYSVDPDTKGTTGVHYFRGGATSHYSDGALYQQSYLSDPTSWGSQIMQDYRTGRLTVRGLNNSNWTTWLPIATTDQIPTSLPANGGTATYAPNSSKLYSTDTTYQYGSASPYYGGLTYNANASRWRFQVSPASPSSVEVAYADSAGKLDTARKINGVPFDGSADITTSSSQVGVVDNIVKGLNVSAGTGLQANISAGTAVMGEQSVNCASNAQSLSARMVSLLYVKSDKTFGKVEAMFPVADANTVGRWILDGNTTIINGAVGNGLAVSNNLTKNGSVTQVDGWIGYGSKGDGSGGHYTSANLTNFPLGCSDIGMSVLYTHKTLGTTQILTSFGGTTAYTGFYIQILASGNFSWANNNSTIDSGCTLENGKTYFLECYYTNSSTLSFYVNGNLVHSVAIGVLNTVASVNLNILKWHGSANYFAVGVIHYVEIRNKIRTIEKMSAICNAMLLPCRYYPDVNKQECTDIRSMLPTNSLSLGYVRTDSTSVIEIDANSYKYGRREGATGGNRKMFLGWQYVAPPAGTIFNWSNPFGSNNLKLTFVGCEQLGSMVCPVNESVIITTNAGWVGVAKISSKTGLISIANCGATFYVGLTASNGYIGCYAEVLD